MKIEDTANVLFREQLLSHISTIIKSTELFSPNVILNVVKNQGSGALVAIKIMKQNFKGLL